MSWEIRNVGWPIPVSNWNGIPNTKHHIEASTIIEPYKIVVIPLYGNNYFYTENHKGRNINFYE